VIGPGLETKTRHALDILRSLEGAVVAFSGGVDSTLLLSLAHEALGDRCVALTAVSPSLPARERDDARELAREMGVRHLWLESAELDRPGFAANPTNRCYFCKSELFDLCFDAAAKLELPAVIYGATTDDLGDHRPGMGAARERGARAPLLEAGLGKDEIRALSRHRGLRTWNKPAMACLSSRFPYGTSIDEERLARVERAEDALIAEGFRNLRVRYHGDVARVELARDEWLRLTDPEIRDRVARAVREAGFQFVALDLEPFRSGRLNETPAAEGDPAGPEGEPQV
jgi:uncharacterized protein